MKKESWYSSENHFFLNPKFPPHQAKLLIQQLDQVSKNLEGHIFLLSSGTTANSFQDLKWVALSKRAFLASADAVNQHLKSTVSDVWLQPLPEFHVGGLSILARSTRSGARVVPFQKWNCEAFIASITQHHVSLTALVPTQLYDLVQAKVRCPNSLRALPVGGGALSYGLYRRALELGWPVLPTYGMTEACSQIATASLESLGSSFSEEGELPGMEVLSHLEVEMLPDHRFQLRGPSLLSGYIYRKSESYASFEDPKEGGWFLSPDKGELQGKHLKICGRLGDFVKIGGESVEVSRLRCILDEIHMSFGMKFDYALLPVPDERLGHVIHFFSEKHSCEDESIALIEAYNSRVLAFERIRKHHRIQFIPRTELGKLIPSALMGLVETS